jgi:hypothetical protein
VIAIGIYPKAASLSRPEREIELAQAALVIEPVRIADLPCVVVGKSLPFRLAMVCL